METGLSKNGQDAAFVRGAFANIARRYVLTNHVLSLGIDILWRWKTARMVSDLHPEVVLDLATGSGDLAAEIKSRCPHAAVLGADFSPPMLQEARKRGLQHLIVADALNLPIADASIDVVTVGFGLRNMGSWSEALHEMSRVLRPGASLFVLDFSLPENALMRQLHLFYLRNIMPLIAGALTGERQAYEYLCKTIELFPSGDAMCCMICQNGFSEARAIKLSFGIASIYVAVK
ncbi:bifunctional demethylmenaquinone methyltransferase/2-methoxy-6-polyprenyl-1,4-benzoquinol methylase UbiE [soil metagenome]